MEDSQKKQNGIGGSFFGCLEHLLSPRCHKRFLYGDWKLLRGDEMFISFVVSLISEFR